MNNSGCFPENSQGATGFICWGRRAHGFFWT
jgi:hypothetical protein